MNAKIKGRVLVIDKYHNTLGPLIGVLEDSGYDVILAIKLEEANQVLLDPTLHIDCSIINVIEPINESFFESLSTLINAKNKLCRPLVVYSSQLPFKTACRMYASGVFQIIEKPCNNQCLSQAIINIIGLRDSNSSTTQEKNTSYDILMQNTPIEISILDKFFNISEWNKSFEKSVGSVSIGDNFFKKCCGENYQEIAEHPVTRTVESKKNEHGIIKISTPDTQKYYNVIATPIMNYLGEVESILVQAIDQTEQIVMEKKLRRQVQNFNRILKEQDRTTDYLISVQKDLQRKSIELERLSITDCLTGINNRRKFDEDIKNESLRASRYKHTISLLLIDIDDFKDVNDTYGHPFGDIVLKSLTTVFQLSIRETDIASRYGGEEFAIILPETDYETAQIVSERIRSNVEKRRFSPGSDELCITVSIGLSTISSENIDPSKIIQLTDECLYEAKRCGKNKVCSINIS